MNYLKLMRALGVVQSLSVGTQAEERELAQNMTEGRNKSSSRARRAEFGLRNPLFHIKALSKRYQTQAV